MGGPNWATRGHRQKCARPFSQISLVCICFQIITKQLRNITIHHIIRAHQHKYFYEFFYVIIIDMTYNCNTNKFKLYSTIISQIYPYM